MLSSTVSMVISNMLHLRHAGVVLTSVPSRVATLAPGHTVWSMDIVLRPVGSPPVRPGAWLESPVRFDPSSLMKFNTVICLVSMAAEVSTHGADDVAAGGLLPWHVGRPLAK
jgi:hypothetical protein